MPNQFHLPPGLRTAMSHPHVSPSRCSTPCAKSLGHQSGLSLIELMVGLIIGLMVVMAGMGTMVLSKSVGTTIASTSALTAQANNILRQLTFFTRQAGAVEARPTVPGNPDSEQVFQIGDLTDSSTPVIVTGQNAAGTGTPATDTITVWTEHRTNSVTRDCLGEAPSSEPALGTWNGNTFSVASGKLQCQTRWAAPTDQTTVAATNTQPIADNVEDFQIRYLRQDPATLLTRWVDASSLTTTAQWNEVIAVEFCLQIRGETDYGALMTGTYTDCAGASQNHSQFQRLVLRHTVQLRNRMNNLG